MRVSRSCRSPYGGRSRSARVRSPARPDRSISRCRLRRSPPRWRRRPGRGPSAGAGCATRAASRMGRWRHLDGPRHLGHRARRPVGLEDELGGALEVAVHGGVDASRAGCSGRAPPGSAWCRARAGTPRRAAPPRPRGPGPSRRNSRSHAHHDSNRSAVLDRAPDGLGGDVEGEAAPVVDDRGRPGHASISPGPARWGRRPGRPRHQRSTSSSGLRRAAGRPSSSASR